VTDPNYPGAALFDVSSGPDCGPLDGMLERVALDRLELAPNPRRELEPEATERLALMLMRDGQLVPCIGRRSRPDGPVLLYDGQRRLLAARASHELANGAGLRPVSSLVVLLVDHEPTADELRRLQAQANRREPLSLPDQQRQFDDCWQARRGLPDDERLAAVCADLGIGARKAHNLRRQLTLPEPIRARVAERPCGDRLSAGLANRLADMHELAPELTAAVAQRITSEELHDKALADMGAFVHRTLLEDERVYAVRIDDGALLDAAQQLEQARGELDGQGGQQAARLLGCKPERLETELDALAARARHRALKLKVTGELRERARVGRYAYVHERGRDFAAGIWVVDPLFMLDAIRAELDRPDDDEPARREGGFFAGARLNDGELPQAGADERERLRRQRERQAEAQRANLGLGHDLAAGLVDPSGSQLAALKQIVCQLLVRHHGELIAYGAGWTDRERQQPVGDTGRYEPRHAEAIVDAELQRALDDPDALRGIAQLAARLAAAFVLDPAAASRTKALGTERVARKLQDALPGGDDPLRQAVWEFLRPMLSPTLVEPNRDAFVTDGQPDSSVDLDAHRGDSDLSELDLGDERKDG
jgi:hypothetical protein